VAHRGGKPSLRAVLTDCTLDRAGVTAIEYALLAGVIMIAITALINGIGASVNGMLNSVATGL